MSAAHPEDDERDGLVGLALASFAIGACAGLVGALFRLTLAWVDRLRGEAIGFAHSMPAVGFLLVVAGAAACAGVAAWLVHRFAKNAAGSGIPQVEAIIATGELPRGPLRLILVKFFGGTLAIGGGLALGREGPSVQMGASIAHVLGRLFQRNARDIRVLVAAGAGAGLATAFNAPIAGAVFVLEELVRRFEPRIAIAALGASALAIAVARMLLGQEPDFHVPAQPYPGFGTVPVHLALGLLAGAAGALYCRLVLGLLRAGDRLGGWHPALRAALIGALVGALAWFSPGLAGGGDPLTQRTLDVVDPLSTICLVFALRFLLGPLSYMAPTPGGLFAPMLVLGAQIGVAFALVLGPIFPSAPAPAAMGIVAMAAFFTAVVRAPLTGIVLVTELTGSFTLLLPMLAACFAAMAVPALVGVRPLYDALRDRLLEREARSPAP